MTAHCDVLNLKNSTRAQAPFDESCESCDVSEHESDCGSSDDTSDKDSDTLRARRLMAAGARRPSRA